MRFQTVGATIQGEDDARESIQVAMPIVIIGRNLGVLTKVSK